MNPAPHQVFEKRRQLPGENGELYEGGADVGVLPAHAVVPELLNGLDVLLLVVHVGWKEQKVNDVGLWMVYV